MQSPVDPKIVFFLGNGTFHWISEDCGESIKTLNVTRTIYDFKFNMVEKDWMLASTIETCEGKPSSSCKKSQDLWVSQNLGQNWTFVTDAVLQFSW